MTPVWFICISYPFPKSSYVRYVAVAAPQMPIRIIFTVCNYYWPDGKSAETLPVP